VIDHVHRMPFKGVPFSFGRPRWSLHRRLQSDDRNPIRRSEHDLIGRFRLAAETDPATAQSGISRLSRRSLASTSKSAAAANPIGRRPAVISEFASFEERSGRLIKPAKQPRSWQFTHRFCCLQWKFSLRMLLAVRQERNFLDPGPAFREIVS